MIQLITTHFEPSVNETEGCIVIDSTITLDPSKTYIVDNGRCYDATGLTFVNGFSRCTINQLPEVK
jgi:hypothetical protein